MAISYCKSPEGYLGIQVNKELVAWVYPVGYDPLRFEVEDESPGPDMSEKFETLTGADGRLWEIARREAARADNTRRRAGGAHARIHAT